MTIFISCGSYSWGGLELFTLESALELKKIGLNAKIFCSLNSKLHYESEKNNLEVFPVFTSDIQTLGTINKISRLIKLYKIHIIHSHHSHDLWALSPAIYLTNNKLKLFLTKHMASGINKKDFAHFLLYKKVHRIFAISKFIENNLLQTCPVKKEKITLLPVGINTQKFNKSNFDLKKIKTELNIPAEKIIIGMAARITPGKGYEEFLNSAKILNEKYESKLHYLVIGTASKDEDKYALQIKNLAINYNIKNLTFYGFVNQPEKIMSVFDILAFPSHDESFGRVLLEAMSLEIPVVASKASGVLDIVTENENGLFCEPKNSNSLANSLEILINNYELRIKLGKTGRTTAIQKFSMEKMIRNLIYHYNN